MKLCKQIRLAVLNKFLNFVFRHIIFIVHVTGASEEMVIASEVEDVIVSTRNTIWVVNKCHVH